MPGVLELSDESVMLRAPRKSDLDTVCDYWYRSPRTFLTQMGVDAKKLPSEDEFRGKFVRDSEQLIPDAQRESCTLIIEYRGVLIGYHKLSHILYGQHGIFHAHIMKSEYRNKGVGGFTYPRALRVYFDRFNLMKVIFKTPAQNVGPNRIKEKMGLKSLRQEKTDYPLHPDGMIVNIYEIYREQLDTLLKSK
ncbi:MAG: GNAT family N-acetyltransferase [Deltaproteobacteria bacterium]|nr:GNAT family N-acetyltransferase [Deltaproteobacteria bacterium]